MAGIERFAKGSVVTLGITFKTPATATPANELTDPLTITLSIQKPDKTITLRTYGDLSITKTSTGIYTSNVTLDQEGTYHWRWYGANGATAAGAATGSFDSTWEPNI